MKTKSIFLIILVLIAGFNLVLGFSDSKEEENLSEEELIEKILMRQGWPPYADSGVVFKPVSGEVYLPVKNFYENQTVNPFGIYRNGRFLGYHSGTDVEVNPSDINRKVPVYSIFNGEVLSSGLANGYGGVVAVKHDFSGLEVVGIYGHVRLWDLNVKTGEKITSGQLIGYLGADYSNETDGERKHLHFGLLRKNKTDIRGYVGSLSELKENWVNPNEFLRGIGAKSVAE